MASIFALMFGGALGTLARYFFSSLNVSTSFPYGTYVVNMAGCFLIGLLAHFGAHKLVGGVDVRLFLMVGFCGAFTTFSTFILETARLIEHGKSLTALFNVLLSVLVGFFLFRLGVLSATFLSQVFSGK